MTDYKETFGFLGIIIGFVGYIPYVSNTLVGITKPHAFSWFIWSLLTGIAFAIQWAEGAGAGSWVTGMTCLLCLCVFVLSLSKGLKTFPVVDWIVLFLALLAIWIWRTNDDPVASIVLLASIDVIAYVPTLRKAFYKPFEETVSLFALDAVKWTSSLFALEAFKISTWLYPAVMMAVSGVLVSILLIRRKLS